jgi:hypothetical protein
MRSKNVETMATNPTFYELCPFARKGLRRSECRRIDGLGECKFLMALGSAPWRALQVAIADVS